MVPRRPNNGGEEFNHKIVEKGLSHGGEKA